MNCLAFLEPVLKEAADIALRYRGNVTPTTKQGDNNQVLTEADIAIGHFLVEKIKSQYPDHNIIDEEAGVIDNGSRYTWVVDPIEGTSNFASGSDDFGIMVGLLDAAEPVAGGIIVPARNLLYTAEKRGGAFKNGQRIRVTRETNLLGMLVSFGIDAHQDDPDRTDKECRLLRDVILSIRNMRNSGCEAVDYMFVAEGIYGGRINMSSKIWDNVAPQIILQEAGGLWTDLRGEPMDYSNPLERSEQNFMNCAASPALHKQLVAITSKHDL